MLLRRKIPTMQLAVLVLCAGANLAVQSLVIYPAFAHSASRTAIWWAQASTVAACVLTYLSLWFLLVRTVVTPLSRTAETARQIVLADDPNLRLAVHRKDELGALTGEFDTVLQLLADARVRLAEQSRRAESAERLSDLLRKARSSSDALAAGIETLRRRMADLATGQTVAAEAVAKLHQGLCEAASQVGEIQHLLADKDRRDRDRSDAESVELDALVRESCQHLPADKRETCFIDVKPSVKDVGAVRVGRTSLRQVLANVLSNAAEAIARRGRNAHVNVRVDAEDGPDLGGGRTVHIKVRDDGKGIDRDKLDYVFDRGHTTKPGAAGNGLHWCANTLAAEGGTMWAESEGAGEGTTIHIVVPKAHGAKT